MPSLRSPPRGCSIVTSGSPEIPSARTSLCASPWNTVVPMTALGVPAFASSMASETPRRAGSSVGGAGEDDVTVLRQARQNLRSGRRRGFRLAAPDHRFDALLCGEDRADLVGKQVEVRLPVVDEADGAAGE